MSVFRSAKHVIIYAIVSPELKTTNFGVMATL